jgi:hypothetical protein
MHSFLRKGYLLFPGLCALAVVATTPTVAPAAEKPKPGANAPRGFRLFARSLGALTINRIYCGLAADGRICVDSTNSSTIGGGFWPKGTADQYVFNSGLQIAGIVGADGGPWAGDTTGAFFFDPKGTTEHGDQVEPIYNTADPDDNAFISDTTATCNDVCQAAKVPSGDANQDLFFPLLRGRTAASQGDVWWLSWDGNPALGAGRSHPLGILVEQRGMGWNFPAGNEDIIYFLYTFYNVTASDPAVYTAAGVRPGMAQILARQGAVFQQRNEASFGIQLPDGGYTVENLFAAFSADMDVAEARSNFSTVNVPFALGNTYEHNFAPATGWTFDPAIFSPPFFPGSGFVGVKYLKSPVVGGVEVGLTLFSNTINGGAFDDAQNTIQLYRYLSNNINPAAGDAPCNTGNPQETRICFVNNTAPDDMRFFQSSGPLTLGPGQFGTIAVAYIFAAPVAAAGCTGPGTCDLAPGDPTLLTSLATADNANPVDSVSGFTGYDSDAPPRGNGNGLPDQAEFTAPVRGSLLDKALVAQQVFNFQFLLPFAPEAPDFFLIPGDNQVTVLWRPTVTETTGDPFFEVASQPTLTDPVTGIVSPNPLYDPNYRQFDVEGYRVYRGRVDNPAELALVAQFDYAGTLIRDFQGQVNPVPGCAPELGINTITVDTAVTPPDTTFGCPVDFDSLVPGVAPTVFIDIPLVGPIIQVKRGDRTALATGQAIILSADTAFTGAASGRAPELSDNGVPFTYLDTGVRSNLRYFYSVTAFDVNSFQSGPSTIESPRNTKPITPSAPASNFQNTATLTNNIVGRGIAQDSVITSPPDLDPTTGTFTGPFPPADAGELAFAGQFARQVIAAPGAVSVRLDSLTLGSAYDPSPNVYHMTATGGDGTTYPLSIPITQDQFDVDVSGNAVFNAVPVNAELAARFGGSGAFVLNAEVVQTLPGNYYTSAYGRGCVNDAPGFNLDVGCNYNGARWFSGPNETRANPTAGNQANAVVPAAVVNFDNAGELPGVENIFQDRSYQTINNIWRNMEGALGGAARAADFNVYWGAGGTVDSVVDVTHNVTVPFAATVGASWGFLNASATGTGSADGSATLTSMDMGCVEPLRTFLAVQAIVPCAEATAYALSPAAVPGAIAYLTSGPAVVPAAGQGFIMYLPGHFFTFELPAGGTVPAAGTVWTMRSYTGAISGGRGDAGDQGDYVFTPAERPFTAVGAENRLTFNVVNQVVAATDDDLSRVHTVPDPYYVTNQFEQTTDAKIIKFVNLPKDCIIRIYSSSGVLVDLVEHHSETFGGSIDWDVRNRNDQFVASGVYFYHLESGDARRVGRFTIVNFAQ